MIFPRSRGLQSAASNLTIGILALQGDFAAHQRMFDALGAATRLVRTDFSGIDGLVIPGGESTTLQRLLQEAGIDLRSIAVPIFGTCAGLITLANAGLLDVDVARNGWGRQIASFSAPIQFQSQDIEGIFIRAPRITAARCAVLATYQGEPVMVSQGDHLATCFHPELTNDPAIPMFFLERCREKQSRPPR